MSLFGRIGNWLGNEWHNTERWLPEIGLGAAAIAAPFLAPELIAGAGSLLGGAEAAGAGAGAAGLGAEGAAAIGAGGSEMGLGAADLGTASAIGGAQTAAGSADFMGAGVGAANLDTIGAGSIAADPTWGTQVTPALSEPPPANIWGGGNVVPQGEGEILGGDAITGQAPTGAVANAGATPMSGQDVINQTFGAGAASPANAESNVMQQGALGATPGAQEGGPLASVFGADSTLGRISGADMLRYGIPLGALGYSLFRGRSEMPPQANQAMGIAQLEGQVGASQLSAAASGQLTPPMQANIDIYTQNAINQLRQQFAGMGRDWQHDTGYLQGVQQIMQQADAMREKYIEMEFTQGLRASGQATGAMMQVAQLQFQEDQQFQTALMNAFRMLGTAAVGNTGGVTIRV